MKKSSERIEMLVNLMPKAFSAADIGCDHAIASIRLAELGRAEKIYACDLREGPLKRAEENIAASDYGTIIETILCDGISKVPDGTENYLIAGMGGQLICRILEEGREKLGKAKCLVLSPHSDRCMVRKKIYELGFEISEEADCFDEGKYYQGICAVKCQTVFSDDYKPWEFEYGRFLIRKKSPNLLRYLLDRKMKIEVIQKQIERAGGNPPEELVSEEMMVLKALEVE